MARAMLLTEAASLRLVNDDYEAIIVSHLISLEPAIRAYARYVEALLAEGAGQVSLIGRGTPFPDQAMPSAAI